MPFNPTAGPAPGRSSWNGLCAWRIRCHSILIEASIGDNPLFSFDRTARIWLFLII